MLGLLAAAAPAYGHWTPVGAVLGTIATMMLLSTIFALTAAVFPRTSGPKLSLIFFGSVSARDIDTFRSEIAQLDDEGYVEDLIQQCHVNAQIAAIKYGWVKRASVLLYVALVPWIAATYTLFRDKS